MRKNMKKVVALVATTLIISACSGSRSESSDLTTESPIETVETEVTEVPKTTETPVETTDPETDPVIRLPSPTGPVGPMPEIDNVCDLFTAPQLETLIGHDMVVLGDTIGGIEPGDMEDWEWPANPEEGDRIGYCTRVRSDHQNQPQTEVPNFIIDVHETETREGMKVYYEQILEDDREFADVFIENNDVFDGLYIKANSATSSATVWCDNRFVSVYQLVSGTSDLELDVDAQDMVAFLPVLLETVCPENYRVSDEGPVPTTTVPSPTTTRPANTPYQGEPVTIDGVQYICGDIAYSPVVLASGRNFTVDYCNDIQVGVFEIISEGNPNAFQDFVSGGAKGTLTTANYAALDIAMLGFSACFENIQGSGFNGYEPFVLMYFPAAIHQEIFDTYNSAVTMLCPPEPIAAPIVQDGDVVPIGAEASGPFDQYGCEQIAFPQVYQDLYPDDDVHASTQCTLVQEAFLSEIAAYSTEYAFHDFVNNENMTASGFGGYSVSDIAFVGWSACSFARNGYDTGAYNNLVRSVFPSVTGEDTQLAWDVALTVVCPMI